MDISFFQVTSEEHGQLCTLFSKKNGDEPNGIISDKEFDKLFDHLANSLARHGTFSESCEEDVDFSGYRYVDQLPVIQTVVKDTLHQAVAIQAALEAVSTAHRPLGASFDFHPHYLLVTPPNHVYCTCDPNEIKNHLK